MDVLRDLDDLDDLLLHLGLDRRGAAQLLQVDVLLLGDRRGRRGGAVRAGDLRQMLAIKQAGGDPSDLVRQKIEDFRLGF